MPLTCSASLRGSWAEQLLPLPGVPFAFSVPRSRRRSPLGTVYFVCRLSRFVTHCSHVAPPSRLTPFLYSLPASCFLLLLGAFVGLPPHRLWFGLNALALSSPTRSSGAERTLRGIAPTLPCGSVGKCPSPIFSHSASLLFVVSPSHSTFHVFRYHFLRFPPLWSLSPMFVPPFFSLVLLFFSVRMPPSSGPCPPLLPRWLHCSVSSLAPHPCSHFRLFEAASLAYLLEGRSATYSRLLFTLMPVPPRLHCPSMRLRGFLSVISSLFATPFTPTLPYFLVLATFVAAPPLLFTCSSCPRLQPLRHVNLCFNDVSAWGCVFYPHSFSPRHAVPFALSLFFPAPGFCLMLHHAFLQLHIYSSLILPFRPHPRGPFSPTPAQFAVSGFLNLSGFFHARRSAVRFHTRNFSCSI